MIDVLETGLPADSEAERALLGAVLEDDTTFPYVGAVLSADDFSLEKHRRIFLRMGDLYKAGTRIDLVTLSSKLENASQLESVGGRTYLSTLNNGMGTIIGIEHYIGIVKEKSTLRRFVTGHQSLIDEALLNGNSREIIDRSERLNRELIAGYAPERHLITGSDIIAAAGGIDGFVNAAKSQGIATPWPRVNRYIGWKPKELTILAARPSVGKTAAALQIAEKAGLTGISVAVFSLEMSKSELLMRMICSRAMVDSNRIRKDELTAEERARYRQAANEIESLPIRYDDQSACTVSSIHAALRRLIANGQVGLVVVDYLQLMDAPGRHQNRTEVVSSISRELKLLASELNLPFIVLSQLSRASDHEGRRPQLSDLRDSGSIEQDANNVIFLHLKEQNYSITRPVQLIIAKQRNGPVGCFDMTFRVDICRLQETEER